MSVMQLLTQADVEVYSRSDWGSAQEKAGAYARRKRTHPMPKGPAKCHFLHITVTSDTDTVMEGAAGAQQVERYGYSTPPMVSYQDLVTNEGRYFEGQSYGVKGTHTINDKRVAGFPVDLNAYGYATAILQNVEDEVTDEQVRVVAMVFAARELAGLVVKGAPIYPHRTFAAKACPGNKAVDRLAEIDKLKREYVKNGLPNIGSVEILRRHLFRAAKASEAGDKAELRRHLRLAAIEAKALRKPVLATRLWALRRAHTLPQVPVEMRQKIADQLWAFRKKHTS